MKTTVFSLLLIFAVLIPLGGESIVYGQNLAQFAGCSGPDCSACNIVGLTNGLIKWLIGFLFVLFALILAYAGFGLVTSGGNSHAMDEAKGRFTNAIIGIIIVLSAWLVVDTIMRGLVGRPGAEGQVPNGGEVSGWLFWSDVQCYENITPDPATYTPEIFEPNEMEMFLIDQGGGETGKVTVSTPAGPQVVDLKVCDSSNMVSINLFGKGIQVHKQFAPSLQRIDAAWRAKGGNSFYKVTSVGGYKCRKIADSSRWSNHAYGLAVDINPATNPHTKPGASNYGATNMPPAFRQLFINEGWGWGGNWKSSKDTMHYSKATGEGGNMRGG